MIKQSDIGKILVTGATGYIGSHLIPRLLDNGYDVRVAVRNPEDLDVCNWVKNVEIVKADVLKPDTLQAAFEAISCAYYFIHSMAAGKDFEQRDIQAAKNFAEAAKHALVKRIIYLGGLGDSNSNLSSHLRSRQDVGEILSESGIPVTEFRAAVIVGSGSLSFEMIRYLTERVPLMICPRWVFTKIQPISIDDILDYLVSAVQNEKSSGKIIEIGGSDVLAYGELMLLYAKQRGLKRFLLRVPVLTPRLSSYWVHLVTPIPSSMAIPLIEGLKSEVIVKDNDAAEIFPNIKPKGYKASVKDALDKLHPYKITSVKKTRVKKNYFKLPQFCIQKEGVIVEPKSIDFTAKPEDVFGVLERMGGENGWWGLSWLWRLRGFFDRLFGGEGFICSRPEKQKIEIGDRIDFLDIENIIPPKELLLKVRFKLPGEGWLRFRVISEDFQKSSLELTAFFAPKGLLGILYWYIFLPLHRIVFNVMLKRILLASSQLNN
jgi:uncharacterized protein YbjT (DUF2867 family)